MPVLLSWQENLVKSAQDTRSVNMQNSLISGETTVKEMHVLAFAHVISRRVCLFSNLIIQHWRDTNFNKVLT